VSTETYASPLLAEGSGVVIRDTVGCAKPTLGRIVEVGDEYALVDVHAVNGQPARFALSTLCAVLPDDDEPGRWKLAAPDGPGSEEYGDLLTRQAGLLAERERIDRQLGPINAVLDAADAAKESN